MKMKIKDSGNIVMNLPWSIWSGPEEYLPNEYNVNNWEAWWAHHVAKGLKAAEEINILHVYQSLLTPFSFQKNNDQDFFQGRGRTSYMLEFHTTVLHTQNIANTELDMVADMTLTVDKVADIVADIDIDINIDMEI